MITAVFTDNSDYARATGLWQWDYGQRLRIEGLKLPTAIEIHFALTEQSGDAIPRVGITKDGVTEVVIPDSLLEHQAAGVTYEIYAWIYLADKTSGETIKRISMQVKCRPKPEGFDAPEDAELFREAIAQVNASADREQIAANKAGIEALSQKKADAIVETAQGETMTLTDSSDKLFEGLRVFGKSTQDGTPSVENPVPIVNAGEGGSITVEVTGRNLLKPNSHNTYYEFPLKANTVITLMTNGKPSQGGNIKFSATDGSNVWFSIDAGQTRVCRSIGNKDVKGFYNLLTKGDGLEYMFAVGDIKTYTPYVEPQSLTLATPNGLPGVPVSKDGNYTDQNGQQWICDEIDLARGKYVQRVLLLKFDSNSPFDLQSINTNNIANFAYGLSKKSRSGSEGICNRLKQSAKLIANETNEGVHISESVIFIRLKTTRASTVEELKQFLANNPTDVLYQIATPIERDLTPEELAAYSSLHTNYPTTVITNDAGAHMEVSYVADTGKYIQNLEERLNAKLVNIQSALISQKISGGGYKGN